MNLVDGYNYDKYEIERCVTNLKIIHFLYIWYLSNIILYTFLIC